MDETTINIIKFVLFTGAVLYLSVPFCMKSRLYYPSRQLFSVDIAYEDVFIPVEKNIVINAWYSEPTSRDITVVFCHGNGGNISFYNEIFRLLQENGYGVLAIDYRGYGKSTGRPNERGLYQDLRAAIKYLRENKNTSEEKMVLWGLSLGGALVTQIASENDPKNKNFRAVILQSTFTNIRDMASHLLHRIYMGLKSDYSNYPTHFLIKNIIPLHHEYRTIEKIAKIKSPILLAHAMLDNIVPVEMTAKLAALCPKAEVFFSHEGGHNEHSWFYAKLFEFLNSVSRSESRQKTLVN
ncbi:MAG: hypothetical protein A2Y25_03500 [Candidatus Melainabacteria bacterium GWF2_37_15]|nr:MAG: hypothetical protein A2Y25_03500 [Candidatus Melainabacteria bacterium GWF2_37_15]